MEEDTHTIRKERITLAEQHSSLGVAFDPLHIQVELPYAFLLPLEVILSILGIPQTESLF